VSRRQRIIRNIAIGIGIFTLVLVIGIVSVVQTDWFHSYVRDKIIRTTEDATGGRTELGGFALDWKHSRAVITDFIIHGKEPQGSTPFLRVARVEVVFRLLSGFSLWDITYLGIERPAATIVILPDGTSNIPTPRAQPPSDTAPLQPVVDLAIHRFELKNGALMFADDKQSVDVRGNNLLAQLWFNPLSHGYRGNIAYQPIYVVSGRGTPVKLAISLPVAIESNRIAFSNARITAPGSSIFMDGSVEDLRRPKVSAHLRGRLAFADLQSLIKLPESAGVQGVPAGLDLDMEAVASKDNIVVSHLRMQAGASQLEASGTLKGSNGSLAFNSRLSLDEVGGLMKLAARPEGVVTATGTASLDQQDNYRVSAQVEAKDLSFRQAGERITGVGASSTVSLDPHVLELKDLRLSALGGSLVGDALVENFSQYRFHGKLSNLDTRVLARAAAGQKLAYDGLVSGPIDAAGDLKSSGTNGLEAHARLSIAPGRNGIPLSGRLTAHYIGRTGDIQVENSFLALPKTRVTLDGSLTRALNVSIATTDLNELAVAVNPGNSVPVDLNNRQARFAGVLTGTLSSPKIAGQLTASGFSVEGRTFDSLAAEVRASSGQISVANVALARGMMRSVASGSMGLRDWKLDANQPLSFDASSSGGDIGDIAVLAGQTSENFAGALNASAHIAGTVGDPRGAANVTVGKGQVYGEPFDRLQAQANMSDQRISISSASIESGAARADLTAEFQHPRDAYTTGSLHAHLRTNQVNLADVHHLQSHRPDTAGLVRVDADVAGDISQIRSDHEDRTELSLRSVNADFSVQRLTFEGEQYGDIHATARTSGQTVKYQLTSDFAGSNIHASGSTRLARDYPTTADAAIDNLPVERLLAVARRSDIQAKGVLSGTAHFTGTIDNPQGSVDVTMTSAVIYDQPIDRLQARASYLALSIDIPLLEIRSGSSHLELTAKYNHPANNLESGTVEFRLANSQADLAKVQSIQKLRSGLTGSMVVSADGSADIRQSDPRILVHSLNANVAAKGIASGKRNFGEVTFAAATTGSTVNFNLNSDIAGASVQGQGHVQLTADYPIDAQLNFSQVTWAKLQPLVQPETEGAPPFDLTIAGQMSARGPAAKPEELSGSVQLNKFLINTIASSTGAAKSITLQNQGPVALALSHDQLTIQTAHLTGPDTDIQASGTASLQAQKLDLKVNANANLALLEGLSRDITASGSAVITTSVRGTFQDPLVNGRLDLHNGTLNYADVPNGISNANGTVLLNGKSASIQSLTAESGGGKVSLRGFATLSGGKRFGLNAEASNVRVRTQGVSIVTDGNVHLTGTAAGSFLSGTATITRITYSPQTDIGSLLALSTPPATSSSGGSTILDTMRLDIRVRTSDALAVQTSLAENLQANSDLRVRGTAASPGVLGRINITRGQLVFFGSTYTINAGSIGFYNPARIEPILDVSLETLAQGVDVVLQVTGPIDNMKVTYTSNPPLPFDEIVALLAAGRTPTSDPTLLAKQPDVPSQSFQQMGESAIVSQAVANPVASRLQRVFGVSQLRISPTFATGSQLPQAQATLQQQIANNITFTYVTSLDNANAQTIRVDWAFNPQWSAVATRDLNGIFSVNLLYKRQIR
jgi:translocation and assembly module TamB